MLRLVLSFLNSKELNGRRSPDLKYQHINVTEWSSALLLLTVTLGSREGGRGGYSQKLMMGGGVARPKNVIFGFLRPRSSRFPSELVRGE